MKLYKAFGIAIVIGVTGVVLFAPDEQRGHASERDRCSGMPVEKG